MAVCVGGRREGPGASPQPQPPLLAFPHAAASAPLRRKASRLWSCRVCPCQKLSHAQAQLRASPTASLRPQARNKPASSMSDDEMPVLREDDPLPHLRPTGLPPTRLL